jgi:hypothetical protein
MMIHDERHLAILGAVLVGALQLTPLVGGGPPAAEFLLCLIGSAALSTIQLRHPCGRASVALTQLALSAFAVHALSSLVEPEPLAGDAFALLAALLLLERGATFTLRLRVLARAARRI